MKKTLTLIVVVLAVLVGIGLAQQKGEKDPKLQVPQPSANNQPDEAAVLNSKPQKQYPEFTLDAQKAAMRNVEQMRKKSRIEGLRNKIPLAGWIEMAYHGLVIDKNLDTIAMDHRTDSFTPTGDAMARMRESNISDRFTCSMVILID